MKHSVFELPAGYSPIHTVDLLKQRKPALIVSLAALVICLLMFAVATYFVPFFTALRFYLERWWLFICFLAAMALYIVLHEWVHGIFIRYYSGQKAQYGFVGAYAFAGSRAYFDKRSYVVIALAPVVVWGLVLLGLNLLLPREWFWFIYFIQMFNLSGAAGDFYIVYLIGHMPADVLTRDAGVSMTMYAQTAPLPEGESVW